MQPVAPRWWSNAVRCSTKHGLNISKLRGSTKFGCVPPSLAKLDSVFAQAVTDEISDVDGLKALAKELSAARGQVAQLAQRLAALEQADSQGQGEGGGGT